MIKIQRFENGIIRHKCTDSITPQAPIGQHFECINSALKHWIMPLQPFFICGTDQEAPKRVWRQEPRVNEVRVSEAGRERAMGRARRFEAGVSIFRRGVEGPDPEDVVEV